MFLKLIPPLCVAFLLTSAVRAGKAEDRRLKDAQTTITEIMTAGDRSIPQDLLAKASCAVIVPGMKKGGFIVAAKYGRGFAICRQKNGKGWTAPAAVRVEGGSFGFQIGGSETDLVMLVMSEKGMERLLSTKFTLGGDATVAAGPVGRESTAQTDPSMRADILSWSRSRGVFGGIALDGATLRPDSDANKGLYSGRDVDNREILSGKVPVPPSAKGLLSTLSRYSGRKG
jgi:SH3 domain-containing YSC84-like protein 1